MRALHEETRRRVDAVLTPAQRQQAEALRAQARTEHVARRVTHLRETLGLNESQTTRVQRVFEQAASRRHAARDAGANTTPEARRTAARAQREQVDSELRQIPHRRADDAAGGRAGQPPRTPRGPWARSPGWPPRACLDGSAGPRRPPGGSLATGADLGQPMGDETDLGQPETNRNAAALEGLRRFALVPTSSVVELGRAPGVQGGEGLHFTQGPLAPSPAPRRTMLHAVS